jgi:hypothetical protein
LFERGEELRNHLEQSRMLLTERMDALEGHLRSLGDQWKSPHSDNTAQREALLVKLEELYRLISFHERWRNQVQNRILQLMGQG